jgi:inorganic pyrophosphatase
MQVSASLNRYRLRQEARMRGSESLTLALTFLGKKVQVIVDRPLGSRHPKHGFLYEANYGYLPSTKAPDGEELDAYFLGADVPLQSAEGVCIAVIHRHNDDDSKLVAVPEGAQMTDEEIERRVQFQEQWFEHSILR